MVEITCFRVIIIKKGDDFLYNTRVEYYKALETEFEGPVIAYITGDRPGFETRIAQDVIDLFIAQLDKIGPVERIVLYLYTRGGDTSAAWNIVNLLKMYCDDLMVIIPHKAHSAGTIISLGANKIVMKFTTDISCTNANKWICTKRQRNG